MRCKVDLTDSFVLKNTSATFFNTTYKNHKIDGIMIIERNLLPMAQPIVQIERKISRTKEKLSSLTVKMKVVTNEINKLKRTTNDPEKLYQLNENLNIYKSIIPDMKFYIQDLISKRSSKHSYVYINKCQTENCQGYLNLEFHCDLCESSFCQQCYKKKSFEHTCHPDDILTTNLLKTDTKPCPGCKTPIFKIEGCSQMFCTNCKTTFDWQTMVIDYSGFVHTPEFFEHMNKNGEDVVFLPNIELVHYVLALETHASHKHTVLNHYSLVQHFQLDILQKYPDQKNQEENLDLRVKFLMDEIDEIKWRSTIKLRDTLFQKKKSVRKILDYFVWYSLNYFDEFEYFVSEEEIHDFIVRSEHLRTYTNYQFRKLSARTITEYITENFNFTC